jgi:hypothetical protein
MWLFKLCSAGMPACQQSTADLSVPSAADLACSSNCVSEHSVTCVVCEAWPGVRRQLAAAAEHPRVGRKAIASTVTGLALEPYTQRLSLVCLVVSAACSAMQQQLSICSSSLHLFLQLLRIRVLCDESCSYYCGRVLSLSLCRVLALATVSGSCVHVAALRAQGCSFLQPRCLEHTGHSHSWPVDVRLHVAHGQAAMECSTAWQQPAAGCSLSVRTAWGSGMPYRMICVAEDWIPITVTRDTVWHTALPASACCMDMLLCQAPSGMEWVCDSSQCCVAAC